MSTACTATRHMDFRKLIGTRLGEYTVRRELGRGGMGAVFEADHAILQRSYAVKLLLPQVQNNEAYQQRFFREARKAASVNHPNVVNVVNAGHYEECVYLVMEYVEGQSLAELLRARGKLDAGEVVAIARQALAGLAAAHAEGIVHRDI
ncbi:MAG: protein kinase, partial [Planctomycetota bacterium]